MPKRKADTSNGGRWLQVSDVTDSWPFIVGRFGVIDPLKRRRCQGNLKTSCGRGRKGMLWLLSVTLIQRSHAADEAEERPGWASPCRLLAAGVSLTCHREARCRFVFNCHIPLRSAPPLVCLTSISPPGVFHILFNELHSWGNSPPVQQYFPEQVWFYFPLTPPSPRQPKWRCWLPWLLGWYFH